MALNLWKTGGLPTIYNPLPSGYGASLPVNFISTTLLLEFDAYSPSSASVYLQWGDSGQAQNLTNINTHYKVSINKSGSSNHFLFIDWHNSGDIVLSNISVAKAPLPVKTINGVDGFLSGNWTLSGKTTVVDDTTLTLNPTTQYDGTTGNKVAVTPNTTYTISASQVDGNGATFGANFYDINGVSFNNNNAPNNALAYTFTTPSNCYFVAVGLFSRATSGFTICTFKNVMLTLGSLPVSYEPKHGTLMVMPLANKNLVPDNIRLWSFQNGATVVLDSAQTFNGYPVYKVTLPANTLGRIVFQPSKIYQNLTASFYIKMTANNQSSGFYSQIRQQNFGTTYASQYIGVPINNWQYFSYTATGINDVTMLNFYQSNGSSPVTEFYLTMVQLEQSTAPTTYNPYIVQLNKVPSKITPKKNLIPDFNSPRWIQDSVTIGGTMTVNPTNPNRMTLNINASAQGRLVQIPVVNGTTYTFSIGENTGLYRIYKGAVTTYNSGTLVIQDTNPATFTVDASYNGYITLRLTDGVLGNFNFGSVQLEQGSASTAYEPYTATSPKANTGLLFNGYTDYVKLNNISRYPVGDFTIETDFMLNDVTKTSTSLIGNDAFGLRYDGANTNSFNFVKYAVADQRVPYTLNPNVRYKLKTIVHSTYTEYFINDNSIGKFNNSSVMNVASYGMIPITVGADNRVTGGIVNYTNGIIYKIHMYDSTSDIVNFDFENASTINGVNAFNAPVNLIPNFTDSGWQYWNIPISNVSFLGLDTCSLISSSAWSKFYYIVNVIPSTKYFIKCNGLSNSVFYRFDSMSNPASQVLSSGSIITTPNTTTKLVFTLENTTSNTMYYFSQPQLYQLTGLEGTVNGTPKQLNKQSKRILYAKR